MIGKTVIGRSFGGCVQYQFEGHKNSTEKKQAEILEAVGVRADSPQNMTADFNRGRKLNPELGQAVWHTSISFNPDDAGKLTNETMLAVAHDYLTGMGLDQTQYAIVRHHDKEHPHFHIVANRVANNGQTISDSHNYKRSEHLLKRLSQKHGLTPVGRKRPERIHAGALTGADKIRYQTYMAVSQALEGCTSAQQFGERLRATGVTVDTRQNAAGEEVGISFKNGPYLFKGSELDRKLSFGKIVAQIEQNRGKQTKQWELPQPPQPQESQPQTQAQVEQARQERLQTYKKQFDKDVAGLFQTRKGDARVVEPILKKLDAEQYATAFGQQFGDNQEASTYAKTELERLQKMTALTLSFVRDSLKRDGYNVGMKGQNQSQGPTH